MKRLLLLLIIFFALFFSPTAFSSKGGGLIGSWISAYESGSLSAMKPFLSRDAVFYFLGIDKDSDKRLQVLRLSDTKDGEDAFWKNLNSGGRLELEEERPDGVILEGEAVGKPIRGWSQMLSLEGGRISSITNIVTEAIFPSVPKGCPETSYKRDLIATLYGNLLGKGPETIVKAYMLARNTDRWESVKPGTNPEIEPYCNPRPGINARYLELLVMEPLGRVVEYKVVGASLEYIEKGEERFAGALWFKGESGSSDAVKILPLSTSGEEGLLAIVSLYRPRRGRFERIDHGILYQWKGGGLSPIWNFDIGHAVMDSIDSIPEKEVLIDVGAGNAGKDGLYGIRFQVIKADDPGYKCEEGTIINFDRKGGGFSLAKGSPSGCIKRWWPGDGSLFSALKNEKKGKSGYRGEEEMSPLEIEFEEDRVY